MAFSQRQRGATFGKVLLLLLFLALAVVYWVWKSNYGIGHVIPLDFNTRDYVAFLRQDANGQTNLYAVKLDGSGERRLTEDANPKQGATWSPDGRQICYTAEVKDENTSAYQLFLFGSSGPKQLTFGTGSKHMPEWRPDGRQIAFLVGGTLKVIDPNGDPSSMEQVYPHFRKSSGQTQDNESDESGRNRPPLAFYRWAPDSSGLAAVQVAEGEQAQVQGRGDWFRQGQTQEEAHEKVPDPETLLVLPVGGGEPALRPETNSNKVGFSWFPDGKRIAVTVTTTTNQHGIMILQADDPRIPPQGLFGSTGFTVSPENPVVSPDGTQVAFEAWRIDSAENRDLMGIAVISTDPSKAVLIKSPKDIGKLRITVQGKTTNPMWSVDGKRLVYQVTDTAGRRDIWAVDPDGSHATNLTGAKGDNFEPACSPAK